MNQQTDYSTQLLDIAGDFVAGLRLTHANSQCIPDGLLDRVEELKKVIPSYMSLDSIEMIALAVLLQKTCVSDIPNRGGTSVLDLLNSIFSRKTPLSAGLCVVKSLCDRDIAYTRKYQGRPVSTAFAAFGSGVTTDLFFDTIAISERTVAWIVGDELMRGFFGEAPYESNMEFINDWSQAINHAFASDFDYYYDHPFWNFVFGSLGARRELDRISNRLAITTAKIPFIELVAEFDLTQIEQLVIMYDLYKDNRDHSWSTFNVSILSNPNDNINFKERPVLTADSRMVQIGLFDPRDATDSDSPPEYHLSDKVRGRIIADADENSMKPLI